MSGTGAFGGDASAKAALLARIDAHVAAGTLDVEADLPWGEGRGSPLGISIEGLDPADYARIFGYPLPLAAALDPLARETGDGFDGVVFARDWVAAVVPGADLSDVPARLILHMLSIDGLDGGESALADEIVAFHRMGLDGTPAAAGQWAGLRARVAACEGDAQGARQTAIAELWSAACWPAGQGRSVVVATLQAWRRLAAIPGEGWSDDDEARALALLATIWEERQGHRDAGKDPDYIAIFRERDPALARGFEANLERSNRRFLACGVKIARLCIALFRTCPIHAAADAGSAMDL